MTPLPVKYFEGSVDIHDLYDMMLKYGIDEKNPLPLWIEISQVVGIDYEFVRKDRLVNPDREFPEDPEVDDKLFFPDLNLTDAVVWDYIHMHKDNHTLDYLKRYDMPAIIEKISTIATSLYSLTPAYMPIPHRKLLTDENIVACVDVAMRAYQEADRYGKALLCITYMEIFDAVHAQYYFNPGDDGTITPGVLSEEQQEFMDRMFTCGRLYNNHEEERDKIRKEILAEQGAKVS